jgi:hypothetical protein
MQRVLGTSPAPSAWLAGLLVLCACSPPESRSQAAAPAWPEGTVLALNGVPLRVEEIDRVASTFAMLEPQDSLQHVRRLALTNVMFHAIAARGIDVPRREEMRSLAHQWHAALVAGTPPPAPSSDPAGPRLLERKGTFHELGHAVWTSAMELEIGQRSDVIEGIGAFHLVKVLDRGREAPPLGTLITIQTVEFPYLDPETGRTLIEQALDRSKLVIVDESWSDVVPLYWQHRMRGESS